ncbi:hypothetical protein PCAR4_840131 [Paraburkholderia caribensis]|nr:hypothetical protein PCAR4_840131 [Paraburkholderia caribensis]
MIRDSRGGEWRVVNERTGAAPPTYTLV